MDVRDARRLLTAARSGFRGVRSTPLVFVASVTTMAAGLLLLGAYLLLVHNMREVLERFGHEFRVVAFLEPDDSRDGVGDVEAFLAGLDGVASVRFVSPDEALARLRADLGEQAGVLDGLRRNPLPGSFELEIAPESRSPQAVGAIALRIVESPAIGEVNYGEDWVAGYARVLSTLEWVGLILGSFLVVVLGAIVAGTVRLALHARADEIEIQRLVGAGGLFVRLPLYLEGALQGGAAAAIALVLLYGMFRLGLPIVGDSLDFLLGRAQPVFFGFAEAFLLFGLGTALGIGGAAVSLLRLEETD